MPDLYRILEARADQLFALPGIEHAAATRFPAADLPMEIRYAVTDRDTLRAAQLEKRIWLATDDKDVCVGFAYATEVDGHAHLAEMDVHPDHGRRGVGKRLLDAVCTWARTHRFDELTLITFRHLPWNAPFYEKQGFVILPAERLGSGMANLLDEEKDVGIDVAKRVAMRLSL